MNRFFMTSAVVCVCLFAGNIHAQPASSPAERAIRPQMTKMLNAANAHDTDAFMVPMRRSPNLVFVINGQVIHGWQALHAQQLKWWNHGKSDARYREDGAPGFTTLGSDAEIVTWPLIGKHITPAGKTVTNRFVVTYVWQRLPVGWRIVYGHESWAKSPE